MIVCNDDIKNIINNKKTISNYKMCHYGNKKLIIEDFEMVIMDFEKSKLNQKNKIRDVINNICKFIASIEFGNNINLQFDYDRNKLNGLKSTFRENINYYNEIEDIIDKMNII